MTKTTIKMLAMAMVAMPAMADELTVTAPEPVVINAGQNTTLEVSWTGGTETVTIVWTNQQGDQVGVGRQLMVAPKVSTGYVVTITDEDGKSVSARTGVKVRGDQAVATFDDNASPADDYDQGYTALEQWYSGSYGLQVGSYYTPYIVEGVDYGYWTWNGYALASTTDNQWRGFSYLYPDQFNSVMGGAHSGDNFVIANPVPWGGDAHEIEVTNKEAGEVISGFYITNTAYAKDAMVTGNKFSTKANKGDWFKVTAVGHHADGTTTTKDFYLADYRAEKEIDRYIVEDWEWFDLRELGEVTKLTFTFDGTDADPTWGLNTPMYFAMDDLGGEPEAGTAEVLAGVGPSTYKAANFFELDADGSMVTFAIEEPVASAGLDVNLEDSKIVVSGKENGASGTVRLSATQKGHTQFVDLTVTVDAVNGIDNLNADADDSDAPTYDLMGRRVLNPGRGIYIRAGKKVMIN